MAKTILITLKKSLIVEAVKADTFQRAQADKSDNPIANAARAYVEAAGDETFHERKVLRHLRSGLAKFATMMNEFVDTENGSLTYHLSDESDEITMNIVVTDRYNSGLAQPLASLAEDYIIYSIDSDWWQQFKSDLAKDYLDRASNTLDYIRLCLAKTAPKASTGSYTDVMGTVVGGGIVAISFPKQVYASQIGQPFDSPRAKTTPVGISLDYSSSNEEVATVAADGTVTLVAAGSTTITARFEGNNSFQPASGSYALNVNPAE